MQIFLGTRDRKEKIRERSKVMRIIVKSLEKINKEKFMLGWSKKTE